MSFFVPEALSIFSSAGAALQVLVDWRKKSKGNTRAIVMELEDNYTYLKIGAKENRIYRWNVQVQNIIKKSGYCLNVRWNEGTGEILPLQLNA